MPKHPDFDKIYVSFVDRYGEKGERSVIRFRPSRIRPLLKE